MTCQVGGSSSLPPTSRRPAGSVRKAGGSSATAEAGSTGRTSRDGVAGPRCTRSSPGCGDGHSTGQYEVSTVSRMRLPAAKR